MDAHLSSGARTATAGVIILIVVVIISLQVRCSEAVVDVPLGRLPSCGSAPHRLVLLLPAACTHRWNKWGIVQGILGPHMENIALALR